VAPARPAADGAVLVRWQGAMLAQHSLGHVNRQLTRRLVALGCGVSLHDVPSPGPVIEEGPLLDFVRAHLDRPLARPADVTVRLAWPLDPNPPHEGRWVIMQPWEYGSIPRAWLDPMRHAAEVWVPSSFVRDGFVKSGVPVERVQVIPLGVDTDVFHPGVEPLLVPTNKKFKFLFVGGTIHRKGIDVLLRAWAEAFYRGDDVCLVIKDMGVGSFYRGQTSEDLVAQFRNTMKYAEIHYLDHDYSEQEMARLYAACDCLVAPYRGEGFGLPAAEAMACEKPVIVTGYGAALDYCDEDTAFLIPAQMVPFHEKRVGDIETVDFPHFAEPDHNALVSLLRTVRKEREEAQRRGRAARQRVLERLTWDHSARLVHQRLDVLCRSVGVPPSGGSSRTQNRLKPGLQRQTVSLCIITKDEENNIGACLESVRGLFDEIIVQDTGSTDRTKEIAREHGAKVFDFQWVDHFAAARNACLEHASGDFIFWLDADDRLDEVNREKLRQLLASLPDGNVAYSMKCLCLAAPWQPAAVVDHVRLFRRDPRIRWRYRIHEQILGAIREAGGQVLHSDIVITHTGYADPALRAAKLQRDLRLLEMEYAEQPHDPFTLFNLGQTFAELRQFERAEALVQESLQRSHPSDSIVRKLYVLLCNCRLGRGQTELALQSCLQGQNVCPNDAELLLLEGMLREQTNDLHGAKAALLRLLGTRDDANFASVAEGLRGHLGRHHLAWVCFRLGEHAEAERLWNAVLGEKADFRPAWLGMGELYLAQGRWVDLDTLIARLAEQPFGEVDALVLRAQMHRVRREFDHGRILLEQARTRWPDSLPVLIQYSYMLLEQDTDHVLADQVLAEILARDPGNSTAQRNRQVLHLRAGWTGGGNT
jgi:glycosyltransferase involved in cell wall biosynthesis/tetratricopeptide (TPR) repeat protein